MELQHRSLEQILLDQGRVTPEDLRKVRKLQAERGERIERLLLDLGFISEEDLQPLLAAYLGVTSVSRREFPTEPVPLGKLNLKYLRRAKVLPLAQQNGTLTVAMADPGDQYALQRLQVATGLDIDPRLARERDVLEGLEAAYGNGAGDGKNGAGESGEGDLEFLSDDEADVDHLRDLASEAPVIRLVNLLINRAVEQRASDIHVEPFEQELKVRYRIDGVLHDVDTPPRRLQAAIASRIKIMAKLNIAERRLPQDGRIKLRLMGKEIDLRVSTLPTLYGESVVLRILDRSSIVVNLETLGFPQDTLQDFTTLIHRPYGMILVTGPTGSGKTTTLYAALSEIKSIEDKIITIEDPVEYQLRGITQIPINEKKGLTFARGLRSILRHDPDKIMVGEIRDNETAQIAINSALTGHLVFTTVHANNVLDVLGRFLNMGVEAYQFVSALNCVLAQRLVRNICHHCKRPTRVTRLLLEESGLDPALEHTHTFYEGIGCIECGGTGYKGRTAICELLDLSDHIREMILEKRPTSEIKKAAREEGMRFLRESAVEQVMLGRTTLREINKVTFVE
jgi:type II secretion system protein E